MKTMIKVESRRKGNPYQGDNAVREIGVDIQHSIVALGEDLSKGHPLVTKMQMAKYFQLIQANPPGFLAFRESKYEKMGAFNEINARRRDRRIVEIAERIPSCMEEIISIIAEDYGFGDTSSRAEAKFLVHILEQFKNWVAVEANKK